MAQKLPLNYQDNHCSFILTLITEKTPHVFSVTSAESIRCRKDWFEQLLKRRNPVGKSHGEEQVEKKHQS